MSKLKIAICKGPSCSLLGADQLQTWCQELVQADLPIHYDITSCTGNCLESPVVEWNGEYVTDCSPAKLTERLISEDLM